MAYNLIVNNENVTRHFVTQYIGITTSVKTVIIQAREGYSSEFLLGVCRPVLEILTLFLTKTFHTGFQTCLGRLQFFHWLCYSTKLGVDAEVKNW